MLSEVLALHSQGVIAWADTTARDDAAIVGDESLRLHEEDGAERLIDLLFGLRSHLAGGTTEIPVARGLGSLPWTDGDTSGNRIDLTGSGPVLVLAHNPGASPVPLAIYSSPDVFNRLDDRNEELPAGAIVAFGPYVPHGWAQMDGYLYVQPAAAGVRLAAIPVGG